MLNAKKQQSYTNFVKPGQSSWYSGSIKITKEKETFKSEDEILNTPKSVRNADIPSDYFD